MPMRSNMVIPATKVRYELSKILPQIQGNQYYTLTYKGYPKVALVDLKYLEQLEDKRLLEKASKETSKMFSDYLKKIGKDINNITEEEANEIIWWLAGIS